MLSFLKKLFGFGSTPAAEAPYKVEAPTVVTLAEPPATTAIPVAGLMVTVDTTDTAEVKPAPKKPRAKKPAAEKKPRAKKAPKA